MNAQHLHDLLEAIPDTREIVVASPAGSDGLLAAWRGAQAESARALWRWCAIGGSEAFATYRAATDRADAAQEALARRAPTRAS